MQPQDTRNSARGARSLALWPSPPSTHNECCHCTIAPRQGTIFGITVLSPVRSQMFRQRARRKRTEGLHSEALMSAVARCYARLNCVLCRDDATGHIHCSLKGPCFSLTHIVVPSARPRVVRNRSACCKRRTVDPVPREVDTNKENT